LYKLGHNLTDEQVEERGRSFTYSNPRYWEDYYNKTSGDEQYDWYGSWDSAVVETTFAPHGDGEPQTASRLGDLLRPYLTAESKILMLGCGNSDMSEKMYAEGFEDIVNIDISETLLQNMRSRLGAAMPRMRWLHMNASALTFESGTFDVSLDKGTLDAIEGSRGLLQAAAREIHRTLRPGGYLLSLTFNAAQTRVEDQLRSAADWGPCHSQPFERPEKRDGHNSRYFIHACQRRA